MRTLHWSDVLLLLMVQQVVRCVDWKLRWLVMISIAMKVLCSVGASP